MTSEILEPRALLYASLVFWERHALELARRRSLSLATGEGMLCRLLEPAHHLAVHRAQQARAEWRRVSGL